MALGGGSLISGGSGGSCITRTDPQITNMSVMPDVSGDGGYTFSFNIEYGTNAVPYDVWSVANLIGNSIFNSSWAFLGEGTNCGAYSLTNQPAGGSFYFLTPPGYTTDGYGTPAAWYGLEGLNPNSGGGSDPNGNGLPNWEEYLYGGNPTLVSGFSVWISQPSGTSGIP
jgi:hypothetical protein